MKKITVKAHIGTGLTKKLAGEKVVEFPESFKEASDNKDWGEAKVLELAARSFVIDEQRSLRAALDADPTSSTSIFKALTKQEQDDLLSGDPKKIAALREKGRIPPLPTAAKK